MTSYSVYIVGDREFTVYAAPNDGKPRIISKMIRGGNHLSYVNGKGEMFSTRVSAGKWAVGRGWSYAARGVDLIKDAIALGVLPKAETQAVIKAEIASRERQEAARVARLAVDFMGHAGVSLTTGQGKRLRKAIKLGESKLADKPC